MNLDKLIRFSIVVIVVMAVVGVIAWRELPAGTEIPIHWDLSGRADGWADKTVGLALMPLTAAAITLLFVAIPRIEPRRANILRSGTAFRAIWIASLLLMALLQVLVAAVALGAAIDVTGLTLIGTGILVVIIGNYLPKVRPNYLVGIRTPWTLTSDLSWTRTHRLGGRLFVIGGLAVVALGAIGAGREILPIALVGGITLMLVIVLAYSYHVWRMDPTRRTS